MRRSIRAVVSVLVAAWLSAASPAIAQSGSIKTETIEYHDDPALWVVGQIKRTTVNGIESEKTDYGWKALPTAIYDFGKRRESYTYEQSAATQVGMLKTVKDGNNNVITLSSWKRGIPQQIQYPATVDHPVVYQKAGVSDRGEIDWVTDENGYQAKYQYDAMGRLSLIDYPDGDTVNWTSTSRNFSVQAGVYGLPNHWRLLERTGNGFRVTRYDALWRPVIEETYDNADADNTRSLVVKRYDSSGRLAFQSYPLRTLGSYTDPALKGVRTEYDALNRITKVKQDAEERMDGSVETNTTYLTGFKTQIEDPNHKITTISYLAYDQPTTDWPARIDAPDSLASTIITRDAFGRPLKIERIGGTEPTQRRYFGYDAHQQLCQTVESETNTAAYGYDGGGNLLWSAAGLPNPANSSDFYTCAYTFASAQPRRVDRLYDARNRLKELAFPDNNGDQTYYYWPDGHTKQISTWNIGSAGEAAKETRNIYAYNKRRLLTGETIEAPDWYRFDVGHRYDANGSLTETTYPSGHRVTFSPDSLGRPKLIASPTAGVQYARDIEYWPTGAIKSFYYGNNVRYTMDPNARQLPGAVRNLGIQEHVYWYDANGNVTNIHDQTRGGDWSRLIEYDALNRVTGVGSVSWPGPNSNDWHRFTYDAQDNLLTWTNGSNKNHRYCYSVNRKLASIRSNATGCEAGNGGMAFTFGYDGQGNTTYKNNRNYIFDYGNRLREVEGIERYRYDGHGRRVLSMSFANGTNLSQYGLSGQLLYQKSDRTGLETDYIHLNGSLLATREQPTAGGTQVVKYHHTDALGSPVAVTNQAGGLLERSTYEPWGKVFDRPMHDGPGYTGHVEDAGTQLTYMQQRYYDPAIGRFLSVDPVTADNSTGANFNRYWYANNNPYRFTDPDGREVSGQYHKVLKSSAHHLSVRATPDNQFKYANDDRFMTDGTGKRYVTFGAGPVMTNVETKILGVTVSRPQLSLVSETNRESDADMSLHPKDKDIRISTPDGFRNEDEFIDALFKADAAYSDSLPYGLPGGDGYNSNSYANGLLQAVGADPIKAPVSTPLSDNPVPKAEFEK